MLEPLRILCLIMWTAVVIYMVPAAWTAVVGTSVRRGDPMRLACLSVAVVNIGFVLRWLFAPENEDLWGVLYLLSAGNAGFILALARAYGRGPRVD